MNYLGSSNDRNNPNRSGFPHKRKSPGDSSTSSDELCRALLLKKSRQCASSSSNNKNSQKLIYERSFTSGGRKQQLKRSSSSSFIHRSYVDRVHKAVQKQIAAQERLTRLSDVKSALSYIWQLVPLEKFGYQFPPVVMRQQLYALLLDPSLRLSTSNSYKSRSDIDRELALLYSKQQIKILRLFHKGECEVVVSPGYIPHLASELAGPSHAAAVVHAPLGTDCIVRRDEYREHVRSVLSSGSSSTFMQNTTSNRRRSPSHHIAAAVAGIQLSSSSSSSSSVACWRHVAVVERFLDLTDSMHISVSRDELTANDLSAVDINWLLQCGLLAKRDARQFWISFPGSGVFTRLFISGRKKLIATVKKAKYQQLLQSDLEACGLPKNQHISVDYHVLDALGQNLLHSFDTTAGKLLRLP